VGLARGARYIWYDWWVMRLRFMCKSKIHRATVTGADLDYVGSIVIDEDLMRRTDIVAGERVSVWNVTNGERIETYALPGAVGAGDIIVNGAAAHKFHEKDIVIIVAFALTDEPVSPKMISVDDKNAFLADLADNREG
jgi:aspartate 1-decarboxylase